MNDFYEDEGFDALQKILSEYDLKDEVVLNGLEKGAEKLAEDVRKMPKPRSQIAKSRYTHLLDTVTHKRTNKDVEIGWGKYYGPMVETGTTKMKGVPHIKTTFEKNKNKYYEIMKNAIFRR